MSETAAQRWARQPDASLVAGRGSRRPLSQQIGTCIEGWCRTYVMEAEAGDTNAMLMVAKGHLDGYGTFEHSWEAAKRWAKRCHEAGNPNGRLFLDAVADLEREQRAPGS